MAESSFLRKNLMIKSIFLISWHHSTRSERRVEALYSRQSLITQEEIYDIIGATSWKRITDHKSLSNLLVL